MHSTNQSVGHGSIITPPAAGHSHSVIIKKKKGLIHFVFQNSVLFDKGNKSDKDNDFKDKIGEELGNESACVQPMVCSLLCV